MIVLYRLPGVAASLALLIYVLIVFYVLAIIEAQLTLQGIAGILLSIGMAVDANVIIFERFREELRSGRTLLNAMKFGFKNALSSIVDSNVTTIIADVLLFFGTGTIKGFATTLIIGVLTSFLTAIFITRFILKIILKLGFKANWLYTR
jgi:protein-export membrane protein SecD